MSVFSFEQYGTGDARDATYALFFFVPCVSPRPLKCVWGKTISLPRVTRYYTCTLVYIIILHFIYLFEKGTLRPVFFCAPAALSRCPPPPPRPRHHRTILGRTPFGRRHTLYAKQKKKKQNKTRQRSVGLSLVLRIIM